MSNEFRYSVLLATSVALLLAGCVPHDMHVVRGLDPKYSDDDVRFRTTYYFRTFDYCWDFNPLLKQSAGDTEAVRYRTIIPKTDTLYRYRMTGKASAAFSRIRFESGILKAADVDPFGTQVSYSEAADGFLVRSASEVKQKATDAARVEEARSLRGAQLRELTDYHLKLDPNATELRAAGLEAVKKALSDYQAVGGSVAGTSGSGELEKRLAAVVEQTDALKVGDQELGKRIDALKEQVAVTPAHNAVGLCPIGQNVRKGFQVMGPEGLKTFDQDDRLVMAMSSSAKPLIDTLQEYSGRILQSRVDVSSQLLALAQENLRTEVARRTVSDARVASPDATVIMASAIAAFDGVAPPKSEEGVNK